MPMLQRRSSHHVVAFVRVQASRVSRDEELRRQLGLGDDGERYVTNAGRGIRGLTVVVVVVVFASWCRCLFVFFEPARRTRVL